MARVMLLEIEMKLIETCHDPGPSYDNLGPQSILTPVKYKLTEVKTESTRDNIHSYLLIV